MKYGWIFVGLVLLMTACSGSGSETAVSPPPKADEIVCTVAYRSDVTQGIEREETLRFNDVDDEQSVAFAEMVFNAAYRTGAADNERNLRLWVTDALASLGTDEGETAVYHSTLYQFEPQSGPQNQFVGGHGFTGLSYSYMPGSAAELQYWCAVE